MKKLFIILVSLIIILSYLSIIKVNNDQQLNSIITNFKIRKINKDNNIIGSLKIKKLNINENLYKINSEDNNVDKHVTILKESILPENDNSIVFIAAHSGTGEIAYFKNLNLLEENDIINLELNNKKYIYTVKSIWEEPKNGYINVNKENEKQLILTTCSPTNNRKQLIVNCIEKESNQ